MYDFSYPLGNAVKSTRYQRGLTQLQVADMADIDVRTVMNIENYKANPKMEVLYPLVRALRIDARTIFTPELQREAPALQQLRLMVEECNEQEAESLIPVIESVSDSCDRVCSLCTSSEGHHRDWIENIKKAEPADPFIREKQALCFKHLARRSIPSSVLPH